MMESYLMKSLYVVGVCATCILVNAIVNKLVQKTDAKYDNAFFPLIKRMLGLVVWSVGLAVVLFEFGVINIMNLVTTAGVGSILIAMLIKDSVSNIVAGITIMFDQPFREGDKVKLHTGDVGRIYSIGLRRTKVIIPRTTDEMSVLVVPNKDLAKAKVYNYTFAKEIQDEKEKENNSTGSVEGN